MRSARFPGPDTDQLTRHHGRAGRPVSLQTRVAHKTAGEARYPNAGLASR